MTTTPPTSSSPTPLAELHVSSLDEVMRFFQTVFTGNDHETADQKKAIMAILDQAFADGYTFNGQPMKPIDLFNWRESFWKRFSEITFRVESALSGPVDAGTIQPTTAVCIGWTAIAQERESGNTLRLRGMNLLALSGGLAVTNSQIGNAETGWQLLN
jgi:hypothetical protein